MIQTDPLFAGNNQAKSKAHVVKPMTNGILIVEESQKKRKGGRPRAHASPENVRELRDSGISWRGIGHILGIGTATAIRLYAASRSADPSQNSRLDKGGHILQIRPVIRLWRLRRIHGAVPIVPAAGKSLGRCPRCNSNVWRKMPRGPVCTNCHPLAID